MPPSPSPLHCASRNSALTQIFTTRPTTTTLPPSFLLPAFTTTTSSFSTTTPTSARKDGNPARGTSALYRSGLKRQHLSVVPSKGRKKASPTSITSAIPKPVLNPLSRTQIEVDPSHGLYAFFPSSPTSESGVKLLATPDELYSCGRAWTMAELRGKDWDDLWRLWWVCSKERNRLLTGDTERARLGNMYGLHESRYRGGEIKKTMHAIRHTLIERWYTWENARTEAMLDPEVNLSADLDAGEAAYLPRSHFAEDAESKSSSIATTAEGEGEAGKGRFTPLLGGKDGKQNATV